ncbi:ribonuclease BN [Oceanicola granulosus HTCC2516]|uniref:Ribonuclease BN n=1 Tax=Oceanicola granulosus (strain ATCC BAA-861 / DSM 15982 / KCTC 12143 / HTCC2516) TaxID=314256 RepID=Q2CIT6_OCEGH|nr:YihY/virulence factor BrkB family protein [Oceanicola granulosus]EAR52503.1 ribonuclease BN [Oceanicola granulosus HTCC2516]
MIQRGRWWKAMKSVAVEIGEKNLGLIAAGCAFFGIVAIFPAIGAIIAIFGLVADPAIVSAQLQLMEEFIPAEAYKLFSEQINALLAARTDQLGWTSLLSLMIALWSARLGVASIMQGLNAIHGQPNRGGLRQIMVALLLTVSLIGVSVASLLLVVIAPIVFSFLQLGAAAAWLLEALRWLVALFILLAGLGILYRFGPNARGDRPSWVSPGAVLAVVLWLAASVGFSLYLANFGRYNEVYGSIGAVIALLIWLYISAFLVLLGAALNAALRRLRRAEKAARKALEEERPPELDEGPGHPG